jgi:hypothetical protein
MPSLNIKFDIDVHLIIIMHFELKMCFSPLTVTLQQDNTPIHISHKKAPLKKNTSPNINVRFDVFTAVTMTKVVLWDINTQFVLHRRHVKSPLQSPAS